MSAGDITNYDGRTRPKAVEVVGQMLPMVCCTIEPSATEASAGSLSVAFTNLIHIQGWHITVDDGTGDTITKDIIVTTSGNEITLANGAASYAMATTDDIHICVWGKVKG